MHDINQIIEAQLASDSAQRPETTSFRTVPFFVAALGPGGEGLQLIEWQPGQELPDCISQAHSLYQQQQQQQLSYEAA